MRTSPRAAATRSSRILKPRPYNLRTTRSRNPRRTTKKPLIGSVRPLQMTLLSALAARLTRTRSAASAPVLPPCMYRLATTMSAASRFAASSSFGTSVSSCCRSASITATYGAELASIPSMHAEARPRLPMRWRQRTRRSCWARSRTRSSEPSKASSTTMIVSQSSPSSAWSSARSSAGMLSRSRNAGTTTLSSGMRATSPPPEQQRAGEPRRGPGIGHQQHGRHRDIGLDLHEIRSIPDHHRATLARCGNRRRPGFALENDLLQRIERRLSKRTQDRRTARLYLVRPDELHAPQRRNRCREDTHRAVLDGDHVLHTQHRQQAMKAAERHPLGGQRRISTLAPLHELGVASGDAWIITPPVERPHGHRGVGVGGVENAIVAWMAREKFAQPGGRYPRAVEHRPVHPCKQENLGDGESAQEEYSALLKACPERQRRDRRKDQSGQQQPVGSETLRREDESRLTVAAGRRMAFPACERQRNHGIPVHRADRGRACEQRKR